MGSNVPSRRHTNARLTTLSPSRTANLPSHRERRAATDTTIVLRDDSEFVDSGFLLWRGIVVVRDEPRRSSPVLQSAVVPGAVRAAVNSLGVFDSVADHCTPAVSAFRRQSVDCALERVEDPGQTVGGLHRERLVVLVSTDRTFRHDCLPKWNWAIPLAALFTTSGIAWIV